ncbi:hypothetical protein BASA81_008412 [Batrachochytrium salamandrivorans]|nr:hypothetical protein BASA81_008412 [Batrachochytrium salamandrivorans]
MTCSKLLMVQTLTRHGTRAPDKIVGKVICKPMFDPKRSLNNAFVQLFGVGATELTGVGVRQMRDVGAFLREKYHGFLSADYAAHSGEWEFVAKEGDRQQRSMMGIVLGVFPNDVVPIAVTNKATDSILGGPAAQCGSQTHDYVIKWHQTKGRALVQTNEYADLIDTLERVCNISLLSDPVNLASRGANPHAYIGDISDFFDSLQETRFEEGLPISNKMHNKLTKLAFKLEHGAHFDFPGGAAMQAGGFPDHLLTDFDLFTNNPKTKPKGVPKIKMHTCSRELFWIGRDF